jgi:isopenicillin-N epimerase
MSQDLAHHWDLDPDITFLNHGSFGACPRAVLETQTRLRARLEREPVRFFLHDLEGLLDEARGRLAGLVGADPDDLAFVPNATSGVNTVLNSLRFSAGDELLTTSHEYAASKNALDHAAARHGARVVVASVPFPLASPDEVVEAVLARTTPHTRLALLDHVTSPTGLVLPIERLVAGLDQRGIDTLVDGAHAPGMVPLDLAGLGAAYFTGNCHKWLCTPKGSALLYVRRDRQELIRPLAISHGASSSRTDRSRFRLEFDFCGTSDPTAWLAIPAAIDFLSALLPGGLAELRDRNRALALQARDLLCRVLDVPPPAPDSMIGSLAAVPLPDSRPGDLRPPHFFDPLYQALFDRHRIEVPVMAWPASPRRVIRIAAQAYNRLEQYERLAAALAETLKR